MFGVVVVGAGNENRRELMIKFDGIQELCLFALREKGNSWVYVNDEKWQNCPKECSYWYIMDREVDSLPEEEVYETDSGPNLPISVRSECLYPWMTIDILEGVLWNLKINKPNEDNLDLIVQGIKYYLDRDCFMEVV